MFFRLLWFAIVSCVLAYLVLVILGQFAFASESGENDPIVIRDELGPGTHHFFGIVMVPRSCDELSVHTRQISPTLYELAFTTWEEPSVPCSDESTARAFNVSLFAPAVGIDFIATEDSASFPIAIVPVVHR